MKIERMREAERRRREAVSLASPSLAIHMVQSGHAGE